MEAPEQVHYFRKSTRKSKLQGLVVGVASWIAMAVIGTAVVVVQRGSDAFEVPVWLRVGIIMVVASVSWVWWIGALGLRTGKFDRLENAVPSDSCRLNCVGLPEELSACGELADVPFEPHLFHASLARKFTPKMYLVFWVLVIPGIAAVHYVLSVLGWPRFRDLSFMRIMVGLLIAYWSTAWLWPAYFRVVPGRLDVMRFSNLRGKPVSIERFDLRTAKLLVDTRRWVVFIDDEERQIELPIALMRDRRRFAHALLLAALSTHEPAPLPDDALLG